MDKISSQAEMQMQYLTGLLAEFKTTMIGVSGVHQQAQLNLLQQMVINHISNDTKLAGTQLVPFGGSLINEIFLIE